MADDVFGSIEKAETITILVLIGVAGYLLYSFYSDIEDFINSLFGVQQGAGSYSNALSQSIQHPIDTAGTILGDVPQKVNCFFTFNLGPGCSDASTVSGTARIGASGQHYRCNATQCYPTTIDANGNETVSGVPVPIDQAN